MSKKKPKKSQHKRESARTKKGQYKREPVRAKKSPAPKVKTKKSLLPLMRPTPKSDQDALYRKIFFGVSGFVLLVMIIGAFTSGINADDEFQHDYSSRLVNYYTSMGQDTSAYYIEKGNMQIYGGFFDLTTGLINEGLGLETHQPAYNNIRHLFNILFGFLTVLFVGLLVRDLAGWRASILALILMALSPRFLGHSFMNPKDIPFAAGFVVALYFMLRLLRQLPKPDRGTLIGLGLGIALAFASRAGGLLLVAYLGLFMGLHFLAKYGVKGITNNLKMTGRYLLYGLGVVLGAYILAILTWPAALRDPINHPFEALSAFSKFGINIRLLFMGESRMSDDVGWQYPLIWIFKTVPLYIHLGFLFALALLPRLSRSFGWLSIFMLFFASLFPILYIISKESILYDGWRHLIFIYPSLAVLVVLGWITMEEKFKNKKYLVYGLYGILGLTALESGSFIARNFQYPYIYFNPIGGGLKGAFGQFELDYWGISVKQAIKKLEKEQILSPNMPDTLVLGTNFYYNLSRQLPRGYKVKLKYIRFNRRYSEDWDYGIFPSRFIRGAHLQNGTWPNSKAEYIIRANNVPILAIEKNTDKYAYQGEMAIQSGNWSEAIRAFQQEISAHPDNEEAWLGLANAQINSAQYAEAIQSANKSLEIAPEDESAFYYKGLANLQTGNLDQAARDLETAVRINDEYYVAFYYLAVLYQSQNNLVRALENAQAAIKASPAFKAAYELAASIYEKQGDTRNAQLYRQAAASL